MGFIPPPPKLTRAEFEQRLFQLSGEHGGQRNFTIEEIDPDFGHWRRKQSRFYAFAFTSMALLAILFVILVAVAAVQKRLPYKAPRLDSAAAAHYSLP